MTAIQNRALVLQKHARDLSAKILGLYLGDCVNSSDRPLPEALRPLKKKNMGLSSEVYIDPADWTQMLAIEVRDDHDKLVFRAKGPPANQYQGQHRGYAHKMFWGHCHTLPPGCVKSPVCWKSVVYPDHAGECEPSEVHAIEEYFCFTAPEHLVKLVRCTTAKPKQYFIELPACMGIGPGHGSPNKFNLFVVTQDRKRVLMPLGKLKVSMHTPRSVSARIEHSREIAQLERRDQEMMAMAAPMLAALDMVGGVSKTGPPGKADATE
jgi:hypothetical protein